MCDQLSEVYLAASHDLQAPYLGDLLNPGVLNMVSFNKRKHHCCNSSSPSESQQSQLFGLEMNEIWFIHVLFFCVLDLMLG